MYHDPLVDRTYAVFRSMKTTPVIFFASKPFSFVCVKLRILPVYDLPGQDLFVVVLIYHPRVGLVD